jgi:TolB-like protein/cytochrome c-type biogenesis protein CcmH/NrfG
MAHPQAMTDSRFRRFVDELRKRKVMRAAIAYVVVAWAIMEGGDLIFTALRLPEWTVTLLVALAILGFPLALVLAWAYELTPDGLQRDVPGSAGTPVVQPSSPVTDEATAGRGLSIAVLPFDDMSEKKDQGYFCEGIAEEILNTLGKVDNLRVASRTSSFHAGTGCSDVQEVGRKLNVMAVLEGSVRKSGEHMRITAQLVKTTDGYHLWSRRYDFDLEDVFRIQDEIAASIAETLSLSISRTPADPGAKISPKAYDFYLRGLSYFAKHSGQDTIYARQMFQRAIDVEPGFGKAWAGLAYTYGFEYMYFNATGQNREEAIRSSTRALELAPDLPESHVSSGIAHCMNSDYGQADREFQRALQLDRGNFEAWYFYGRSKVHEGDIRRAIELFEGAATVRPEDYQSKLLQAQLYVSIGEPDKAIAVTREGLERARRILELNPDDVRAWNLGAFGLLRLGEKAEAVRWIQRSLESAPRDSIVHYNAACFFALAGEKDKALDCLERCLIKVGNISREWLEHDSDLDSIRSEPRFREVVETLIGRH